MRVLAHTHTRARVQLFFPPFFLLSPNFRACFRAGGCDFSFAGCVSLLLLLLADPCCFHTVLRAVMGRDVPGQCTLRCHSPLLLLLLLLRDSEKFIRLIAFREAREVVFFSFFFLGENGALMIVSSFCCCF